MDVIVQTIKDLIRKDDPSALELIYDTWGIRLYHYLLSFLGSETKAEDVMQDVFVRLAEKRRKLLDAKNMEGYIFMMARNLALDMLRSQPPDNEPLENYQDILVCPAPDPLEKETREEIWKAMSKLPPEQREVLSLKCFEGMTFEEIARVLAISANTAASRYRYAIDKLREMIKKDI